MKDLRGYVRNLSNCKRQTRKTNVKALKKLEPANTAILVQRFPGFLQLFASKIPDIFKPFSQVFKLKIG